MSSRMCKANIIIINPLILPSHTLTTYDEFESIVFKSKPNTANTTENPDTKNTLLRIVCALEGIFSDVLPDIYAINPGIIGNIHGLKKEINPANNATQILVFVI